MNKKLICTAVGSALALVGGAASAEFDTSSTDRAFAGYVVKDANRTTVLTLIGNGAEMKYTDSLHIQYWTKSTTDANTAACQPSSVYIPFTDEDIVTWDTAGLLGYPLFGDTTNPAPLGLAISYAAPRHGYMIAYNSPNYFYAGYWLELDLANGGAHGDMMLLNDQDDFDEFDTNLVLGSDPINSLSDATAVNFWPSSVASSVFTVTPLGTDMFNRENNQVVMQVFNSNEVQGAYDRNENGVDGTVPVTVRCVGRVTPAQLMPGVVANVNWAKQGGWGYLANLGDGDNTANEAQTGTNSGDLDALVYQVDTSSAGGKFISNATRITSYQW